MNFVEIMRFAVRGLASNKLRSVLTTLGITIGVASVILLVAVGNGASAAITASIQGLGTDVVNVTPVRGGGQTSQVRPLTVQDAHALIDPVGAPDVKAAAPVVNTSATATYGQTSYDVSSVVGTEPSYFTTTNRQIADGQLFSAEDVTQARKVVVLGPTTAQSIFGAGEPVGKNVLVNSIQFTVIGVLQTKGSTGLQNADDVAIAPISAVQNSLAGYGGLNQIAVQATTADAIGLAQAEVTAILDARHGIQASATPDFQIQNSAQLLQTRTSAIDTFTVLLGAVAAISLLVGGIGVTNIMLVTVTERIREIGIRKAIGAPRSAILGQFLAEATMLSLFGGLLGVLIGVVGSRFSIAGIQPVVVPSSIALAFAVSALIGLFFGSFPANRASRLRPIDALRHE
ncbi:FtsX-like permease family protein [Amycolatopsis rubida]|uniref:FtsX-like permease family protein n=1 Tax=Amycolatopsis rubida TaxID=112413 RepID=A0ABX0BVZ1_9PSEU|nr:ABC transporter permease [Amycolatopsis sp. M39]MYW94089.1 FtsX-like permease family protein [Amycolatopsis rubida]NEC59078.1 FtsX-like permease family protein [Amycolatopsis rubida]OAP22037.1 Macrolide export ATP-binding/permease protein MacB [Amycolatopsis sp. M39]